jgi:hypothetical protein
MLLVKELKKDMRFCECDMGMKAECIALENARRVDTPGRNGYECKAENIETKENIIYFQSIKYTDYPKLYLYDPYFRVKL